MDDDSDPDKFQPRARSSNELRNPPYDENCQRDRGDTVAPKDANLFNKQQPNADNWQPRARSSNEPFDNWRVARNEENLQPVRGGRVGFMSNQRTVGVDADNWQSHASSSNEPHNWRVARNEENCQPVRGRLQSRRGGRSRVGPINANAFKQRPDAVVQRQNLALANEGYEHHHRGNSNANRRNKYYNPRNRTKDIGFKRLEEIAQCESQDAFIKLMESKDIFIELVQSPIERFDLFVLILQCLAKVCQSSFDELKMSLMVDVCSSNFIVSLKSYLMELPYVQEKATNNLYWNNPDGFWNNLIKFCQCVITTAPTLALNKCRSLVEATTIACLDGLKEKHSYVLPPKYTNELQELRQRMAEFEKMNEGAKKAIKPQDETPPENFRELSLMPTREDLLVQKAFVRPNIVDGAYQDVEHYLDVQFRLLREDCFGPLRDGLRQYIKEPNSKRYDHIRVISNVKFLKPYISTTKIGSVVQIDMKTNKYWKRINWSHSKRFIFGSLVLFTKDNCKTFLFGIIIDRDLMYLQQGLIPVSLMETEFNERLYNDEDCYTMIESEVYFEPYYHVLRALQDPTFPEHIAMKQYIVDVNPEPKHPSYLDADTKFSIVLKDEVQLSVNDFEELLEENDTHDKHEVDLENLLIRKKKKFTILNEDTWPDKDELQFNESQYEAYKLALTHEFAVIQGPPGTGKTYLGIKVATTLIENLKTSGCLMLVICYTNHALDQFLEALLKVTNSIVRIGGQSHNEAMDNINLKRLRRAVSMDSEAYDVCVDQEIKLELAVSRFQRAIDYLDVLLNGVMRGEFLTDIPEIALLLQLYGVAKDDDPLFSWLFENFTDYYTDIDTLLKEFDETSDVYTEHEIENRKKTGAYLDEQEIDTFEQERYLAHISSFSLDEIHVRITELIVRYKAYQASGACNQLISRKLLMGIQKLNSYKELYKDMSQHRMRRINVNITERTNFSRFAPVDRWTLYFTWIHELVVERKKEIGILHAEVNTLTTAHEESRMLMDMQVLKNKKIVGMTTSGAARMRKLLQTLAPPIVIVEEAAEVLEQHIIASLTKDCKHLILIGDHQQLRPSASHMLLARHYQLEVSLFERMITNGIHSRRLSVQHRMRPEIAALICPHIYKELDNHCTVHDFPHVKGMDKNVFFLTHDHKEDVVIENMSRTNQKEADLVLALANYLMQQGYTPDDVTVLAAYKGQMFYMKKESEKYDHLKKVKITVVDNYQGEESKIILLSLVRNNDENKIGFLGTANRICVAMSRAKEGFYMFGNIENLKANSELWRNIATTLEIKESVGTSVTLKCQNHPTTLTNVSKIEDFGKVPEGGCTVQCNFLLSGCGHKCPLFCHGYDSKHTTSLTTCRRPCERVLCDLGHVCPDICSNLCGVCKVKVKKTLRCGHEMSIWCYMEPNHPLVKCCTIVDATLPFCGHKTKKMCHENIRNIICPVNCEFRLEKCGHVCLRKCHVRDDPEHKTYRCEKQCTKAKKGCTADLEGDRGDHQCVKKCHETCDECDVMVTKRRSTCNHSERVTCKTNVDGKPCLKNCARKLPCDHFCKKKCGETCGDCEVMVKKEIPDCKHVVEMMCKQVPTRALCTLKCQRMMSCGHKCKGICGEDCDRLTCAEPSTRIVASPCGHNVSLPCNIANLSEVDEASLAATCQVACTAELACKHLCRGTCAQCHAGRLHAPCTQPCQRTLICGHICEEPCNQICPPCGKRCEVRCQHSRCNKLCGEPCTPCQERCGRRCEHLSCGRRCGETCERAPCSAPCAAALPCGHACRGLCGEPCPPVCALCDPDNFPTDFLGDAFDDDAKFILLQDCGHVMEVENMDTMMLGDRDSVDIRKCPFCRKPIINTKRYKEAINKMYKEEIDPIKRKIYGNEAEVKTKKDKLIQDVLDFRTKHLNVLKADKSIKAVYLNLKCIAKTKNKISKLQVDMESICLNILDMITECYKNYLDSKLPVTKLEAKLKKQTKLLCEVFVFKVNSGVMLKVSEQQQKDMNLEIKRMNSIVQLAKLCGHPNFKAAKSEVRPQYNAAKAAVFTWTVFDESRAMKSLENLQDAFKASSVVLTKLERAMIVSAMTDLGSGRWFKCPQGHFYCIGECGGAMQESKCPECGALIGGRNHTLTAGNAHAPEMDGSRFPAWSQEYNNMANFNFNF